MSSAAGSASGTHRHLTHVARGGALGLAGAGVSAVASFLLVVVVTNGFSIETAGAFFTATSMFLLLTATATLGSETGLARFMLKYEAEGRKGDIPPTLRSAMRPTVAFSVVLSIGLLLFAEPLASLIGLTGEQAPAALRVLAVLLPFSTVSALSLAGTRAFGRMQTTVLVDKVLRPAVQPALAVVVSMTGAGLLGLTLAWAVPYGLAALLSVVLLRRFLHRRGSLQHREATKDIRTLRRDFWSFAWPRAITRISAMAIQRLDIILVASLRSPTEAAIYTAATRFVALGQFGTQAIQQVIQPKFTALLAHREHDSLREVFQVSTGWSMAVSWPMYVAVGSAPLAYLGVFGERFAEEGAPTVVLMSMAMLVTVATGPVDTLLLMSGRSRLSLVNSLAALAVDVGLCLWLIPRLGITGAAVAWAVAAVVRAVLSVIQVRSLETVVGFGRPALVVALACLGCIAAPLLVISMFYTLNLAELALVCLVCAPFYLGVLFLGRRPLMLTVLRDLGRRPRSGDEAAHHAEV